VRARLWPPHTLVREPSTSAMGMKIGPLLERAGAIRRELAEERRAAYRSAPVPFVPEPPPPGWIGLEEDIAEVFDRLGRSDAAEEGLWRLALWLRRNLSTPHVAELRRRRRLAGCCRECPRPAKPGRRWCEACLEVLRQRGRRRRERAAAAGRCQQCSGWATPARRTCSTCRARKRTQVRSQRELQTRAGLCTHGCCPNKATRGKYCTTHAEANVARAKMWREKGRAEGRCLRCTDPATRGVFCDAHADENRERARQRASSTGARRVANGA